MYDNAKTLITDAKKIIIIQAENPDGDSLGSSLALEELLGDMGKDVVMYCNVEIPKYMRYIRGWDRVVSTFDTSADLAIIVDTVSDTLLSKTLGMPGGLHYFESHPVLVIDHHIGVASSLPFNHELLVEDAASATQVIYNLAADADWAINQSAAESMLAGLLSDTLGLSTQNVTSTAYLTASKLTELGAHVADIEDRRREFMKKSPEILAYKGELISRISALTGARVF